MADSDVHVRKTVSEAIWLGLRRAATAKRARVAPARTSFGARETHAQARGAFASVVDAFGDRANQRRPRTSRVARSRLTSGMSSDGAATSSPPASTASLDSDLSDSEVELADPKEALNGSGACPATPTRVSARMSPRARVGDPAPRRCPQNFFQGAARLARRGWVSNPPPPPLTPHPPSPPGSSRSRPVDALSVPADTPGCVPRARHPTHPDPRALNRLLHHLGKKPIPSRRDLAPPPLTHLAIAAPLPLLARRANTRTNTANSSIASACARPWFACNRVVRAHRTRAPPRRRQRLASNWSTR